MTPANLTPPLTLADIAQLRLELRRAAKTKLVAQNAQYTGQYA
jgi:hypothetical protein